MRQCFSLDRGRTRSYYAAVVLAGVCVACHGAPPPIAPAGLHALPAGTVASWTQAIRPGHPTQFDLRWRFTTQQGSAAGRAVVRYQGPDTLRFDYRAPFGRSGAALFVGPEAVWAQPAEELRELVPTAPLFWVGLGLPLDPRSRATVTGLERDGTRAWRYAEARDVLDVVWQAGTGTLRAEYRRDDKIIGLVDVQFDSTGRPMTAELRFPGDAARLTFRFEAVDSVAVFAPQTWHRP